MKSWRILVQFPRTQVKKSGLAVSAYNPSIETSRDWAVCPDVVAK